jgi:predicted membrane protein
VFLSCTPNRFRYNMFYYYIVVRTQVVFRRNIYFLLAISGLSISAVLLFSGYHLSGATLLFFCLLLFFKAYRARQLPLALSIPHTPLFLRIYIRLSHVEPFRLFRVGHAILCLHTFLEDFRLSKDEGFRRMRYLRHK